MPENFGNRFSFAIVYAIGGTATGHLVGRLFGLEGAGLEIATLLGAAFGVAWLMYIWTTRPSPDNTSEAIIAEVK